MANQVLIGGEKYSKIISKRLGGSPDEPEISYYQARERLLSDIASTRTAISRLPQNLRLPSEFVVCVRMNPKYSAKSYFPKGIFRAASGGEIDAIGSRSWHSQEAEDVSGKLIFARTTDRALSSIENFLQNSNQLTQQFVMDVRRIEKIDLLSSDEKLLGFDSDWTEGYVEFVFHPFERDKDQVIETFQRIQAFNDLQVREYESGIIFASAIANREALQKIKDFNPLRSIHPIEVDMGVVIRTFSSGTGPVPPKITNKNKIQIGVIDTGIDPAHPYFQGSTENEDHTDAPASSDSIKHGTAVTGMILFGNLDQYAQSDTLPEPDFFVKSFRVLPQGNSKHTGADRNQLYDVIDEIEKIVPENPDIKVYNISLGPRGPIYDDYLTRFTYVCDYLSKKHDIQFCVAVGNDGTEANPRIQSPSDAVNVISVGAYTLDNKGEKIKADYSCVGPGREGNKLKPDLLAFGGCDKHPMHYVSPAAGARDVGAGGTSLATPQVTTAVASLIGKYSLDPLSSRSLLLNRIYIEDGYGTDFGHGVLPSNLSELTICKNGTFTLQYRGRLLPTNFAQLQIPWPDTSLKGKVTFYWTLAVLADTDELSTDEYTKESMEVTFYPNDSKFVFTSPDGKHKKVINIREKEAEAKKLLAQGWTIAHFPKSEAGPKPSLGEEGMRANMKWDTILQGKKSVQRAASIRNPFFHLHCLARDSEETTSQVDYCLTLTVKLHQSDQDIYSAIVNKYSALVPIAETIQQKVVVRSESEVK